MAGDETMRDRDEGRDGEIPTAVDLSLYYFLFLGSLGSVTNYLPLALMERGLSLTGLAAMLSLIPLMRLGAPALWGYVADRFRMTALLLQWVTWLAFLTYIPLLWGGPLVTAVLLLLHWFFRIPGVVLADALAFRRVRLGRGDFGSIRMWGTVGYVAATLSGGYIAEHLGAGRAVESGIVLLLCAAVLTHRLPRAKPSPTPPLGPALMVLARRPAFQAFFVATFFHFIGQSTYDYFFPVHLESLGFPKHLIGIAISLGATMEVLVMWRSRQLIERLGLERVMLGSAVIAMIRWISTAWVTSAWPLVMIQVAHGITFGAWYIAAATWVARTAPREINASALALFSVASFGLGSLAATGLSAWLGELHGTRVLFAASASTSALAAMGYWVVMRGSAGVEHGG